MRRISLRVKPWGALLAQTVVLVLFFTVPGDRLSYLWYNVIGCFVCIAASFLLQNPNTVE